LGCQILEGGQVVRQEAAAIIWGRGTGGIFRISMFHNPSVDMTFFIELTCGLLETESNNKGSKGRSTPLHLGL